MREAAIRSLVYIGLAGPGVDERAFEVLRRIREGQGQGLTVEEFKALLREQFFALLLDQKSALAAIPKMLPEDPATRNDILEKIRRVVSAVGTPEGVRAARLAEIEQLFGMTVDARLKKRISTVGEVALGAASGRSAPSIAVCYTRCRYSETARAVPPSARPARCRALGWKFWYDLVESSCFAIPSSS